MNTPFFEDIAYTFYNNAYNKVLQVIFCDKNNGDGTSRPYVLHFLLVQHKKGQSRCSQFQIVTPCEPLLSSPEAFFSQRATQGEHILLMMMMI